MPTWRSRFRELSDAQARALKEFNNASSHAQRKSAMSRIRATADDIAEFLKKYESAGFPDHDERMPND